MDNLKKELEQIFAILSTLSVSGDVVDIMAAVRSKLKKAMEMCNIPDNLEGDETNGG